MIHLSANLDKQTWLHVPHTPVLYCVFPFIAWASLPTPSLEQSTQSVHGQLVPWATFTGSGGK